MASVREGGPAATDGAGTAVQQNVEHTTEQLVALADDVLQAFDGAGPTQIEVSPGVGAEVETRLASEVSPGLRGLRSLLDQQSFATETTTKATVALRDLLEIVLHKALPLVGEGERVRPADTNGLGDAVGRAKAAVAALALEQTGGTEPEAEEQTWTVRNLTAQPIELRDRGGAVWVIPAHGRRTMTDSPRVEFGLRGEEGRGEVDVTQNSTPTPVDYSPLALWFLIVPVAFGVGSQQGKWGGWIGGAIAFALPLVWVFATTAKRRDNLRNFLAEIPGWAAQALTFLIVLTFCLAVPAATLYYGANLKPIVSDIVDGNATSSDYLTVVCRTMQLVLISVASLLPALLYYQFDRDRLSTLRERFQHQIFRLDPEMKTTRDIDAKYGRQIDEIYGPERSGRSSKLPPGRRAPIFVATVLIMLGWLLVLLNPDVGVVDNEEEIAALFDPRHTAPAFAFLGAYFFTLFALLRGYVRRDLRPKSYSDISVRIVTVVVLAWVLELMFVNDSSGLLVFAFLVGIVPQAALNRLRELSQTLVSGFRVKRFPGAKRSDGAKGASGVKSSDDGSDDAVAAALADPLPLTDLQGIDLYDRTRLSSEGVTNIEALAHHDLIELMLLSRIPVPRLVDWTDQAILHLHLYPEDRATLRRYGIRTASDLVHAHRTATKKDEFLAILGGDADKPKRLEVIVEAMKDEPWMDNILFWHGDLDTQGDATKGSP
jgi:hypothetical protein